MKSMPGQKVVVVSASGVSGWPRVSSPPVRLQSPLQSQARYISSRATSESAWGARSAGARSRSSSPQAPVFVTHTHPSACSTPCPVTAYAPSFCKGCPGGHAAIPSPRVVMGSPRGVVPTPQPLQVPWFQGRAVYASAAVPAARQHTMPSRVGRSSPVANQKWHMASAPAMPWAQQPWAQQPWAQPHHEEVDSEYSPRDSVWKRYFCNGQKGSTSPSSTSQKQAVSALHERSANVEKPNHVEEVKLRSPLQEATKPLEGSGVALDDCAQSQLLQADAPIDAKVEEASLLTETPLSQQSRPDLRPESRPVAAVPSRPPAQERSRLSQAPLQNTERLAVCADNVSEEELLDLSALTRPPAVRGIVESALMLLGFRDASWTAARAAFEDPEGFKEKLRSFNASKISRLQYQKLRRSLAAAKGLDQSRSKCGTLEEWCCAVADVLSSRYSEAALAEAAASKRLSPPISGVNGFNSVSSEAESWAPRPALGDLIVTPDIYSMTPNELRHVRDLKVHRPKVGEVTFHGEIDLVSNSEILEDLPNVVRLEPGEVVLYPDRLNKPFEGYGLNRPATITLFGCLPPGVANFDEESKARYRHRIAEMTEEKGARFLDYDCDKGLWQFCVDHF